MLLEGMRVIDCGSWVAAPAAATVMGDFGAEVIKIEPPAGGDTYRWCAQFVPGFPQATENYPWQLTGRNKKSVMLDLKRAADHAALIALVRTADVFLTNFPPAVLAKLGLRWEDLREHNPRLVYGQLTGYGERGPHANLAAFDRTGWWARSGMMDRMRYRDAPPAGGILGWGDHATSMSMFGAVMLGLYQRERTGQGSRVYSSLLANGLWANAIPIAARLAGAEVHLETPRHEMSNALAIPYGTRDGHWFYPWLFDEERDWLRFAIALGLSHLGDDARFTATPDRRANAKALIGLFEERIAQEDWSHWQSVMAEQGIDLIAVSTLDEVIADPQVLLNDGLLAIEQPSGSATHTVNSPIFVEGAPKRCAGPAPAHGQHTADILDELGLSAPGVPGAP